MDFVIYAIFIHGAQFSIVSFIFFYFFTPILLLLRPCNIFVYLLFTNLAVGTLRVYIYIFHLLVMNLHMQNGV